MDCDAVLEIVGSTPQGLQANHAKRTTTDHPAREDAAPTFWQTDTGSIPSRSGGQDAVTYV